MSKILCDWLNNDIKLSVKVTPGTLSDNLANGYLIGELLYKCNLQDDLDQFKKGYSSDAKITNFKLLKNVLMKLDIPFPAAKAEEIMQGKAATTTKFVYELRSAVERLRGQRKNNTHQTSVLSLTASRGQRKGRYEEAESKIFNDRIKLVGIRKKSDSFEAALEKFRDEGRRKEELAKLEEEVQTSELWKMRRERHDMLRARFHSKQAKTKMWSEHFQKRISVAKPEQTAKAEDEKSTFSGVDQEFMQSYESEVGVERMFS